MMLDLNKSQLSLLGNLIDNHIHEQCHHSEDARKHGEDIKDTLKYIKSLQVLHTKISKLNGAK
tara:strand:+ start:42 stop:230 length:189 start_codon:yes stop_codon:yes gene_type:complete